MHRHKERSESSWTSDMQTQENRISYINARLTREESESVTFPQGKDRTSEEKTETTQPRDPEENKQLFFVRMKNLVSYSFLTLLLLHNKRCTLQVFASFSIVRYTASRVEYLVKIKYSTVAISFGLHYNSFIRHFYFFPLVFSAL